MQATVRRRFARVFAGLVAGVAMATPVASLAAAQPADAATLPITIKVPDLVVTRLATSGVPRFLSASGMYGQYVSVDVKNQGTSSTPSNKSFAVEAWSGGVRALSYTGGSGFAHVNSSQVTSATPIAAGETRSFNAWVMFPTFPNRGTSFTIKADSCYTTDLLGPNCNIVELNESNNTRSATTL